MIEGDCHASMMPSSHVVSQYQVIFLACVPYEGNCRGREVLIKVVWLKGYQRGITF